jgi:hypothetical protein
MLSRVVPPQPWWPRRDMWLALLLFTGLALLFAYPISVHPATLRFPTGPDGDLGWYLLGWDVHAFLHRPWAIFDANIYYPERLTLAYGENVIGLAFFAAPVIWLTGNLLLAANFVSLLSPVLCGLAAYVLARRLRLSVAAAIVCGVIFECAPPRFFRIGQINLTNIEWIPFGLAALHSYLESGRRRALHLAIACFTIQTLSCGYAAGFMAVAVLLFVLYYALAGEPVDLKRRLRDIGPQGVLLLVPVLLVYLPYQLVQADAGLRRGLGTWTENYSSFVASPTYLHQFLRSLVTTSELQASSFLFPGYLALLLGMFAAVAAAIGVRHTIGLGSVNTWRSRLAVAARVYWRPALALLFAIAAFKGLGVARQALPAGVGLTADYFEKSRYDAPVMSVVDAQPTTELLLERWNYQPPPTFNVTWRGYLSTLRAGLYFFATTSEDRSRLYIDDQLVIDNTGGHANGQAGAVRLDRGSHLVVLEYEHGIGRAALKWEWIYDGDRNREYKMVPRWALSQRPIEPSTVVAARVLETLLPVARFLIVVAAIWCVAAWPLARHAAWRESRARFRRVPTGFYLVLTIVCALLALGPPYGLWQYVYWMPGFSLVRANARFGMIALLGLAVLAGIGFDRLTASMPRRRRRLLAAAAVVVLIAEYAAMPMASQPVALRVPDIDRWLNFQPKPFVVAEVPVFDPFDVGPFERQEVTYMLHSTAHWQKTVHGYSGWRTDRARELFRDMQSFPDDTSLASLESLGVTYIVVHSELYAPEEWKRVADRIRGYGSRLRFLHAEGAGRAYALTPNP